MCRLKEHSIISPFLPDEFMPVEFEEVDYFPINGLFYASQKRRLCAVHHISVTTLFNLEGVHESKWQYRIAQ